MATTEERNAGFDAGKAKVLDLVKVLVPDGFLHDVEVQKIDAKINDPANAQYILAVTDAVLDAAEAVRSKPTT